MNKLEFLFVALLFFCAGAYFHKAAGKVVAHIAQEAK
jgi:hypothetical protein